MNKLIKLVCNKRQSQPIPNVGQYWQHKETGNVYLITNQATNTFGSDKVAINIETGRAWNPEAPYGEEATGLYYLTDSAKITIEY